MIGPDAPALQRLEALLEGTSIDVEVVVVGGAVLTVAFAHDPGSRRPGLLLGDPDELARAVEMVAADCGLAPDWLSTVARALMSEGGPSCVRQGPRLSVYAPRPEYALALKCAELAGASDPERGKSVEADLRYLIRLLELQTVDDVLLAVGPYFTARQLGAAGATRLAAMLS